MAECVMAANRSLCIAIAGGIIEKRAQRDGEWFVSGKVSVCNIFFSGFAARVGDRVALHRWYSRNDRPRGSRIWRRLFAAVSFATEQSTSADNFAGQLLEVLSRWSARGSAEELDDDITMVAIHVQK